MLPKRRFWNAEQTIPTIRGRIFKALFTYLSTRFGLHVHLKSALKIRSRMFDRPSKIMLPTPNEDFGRLKEHSVTHLPIHFHIREYSICATFIWKVLWKYVSECLLDLPKSSFGDHKNLRLGSIKFVGRTSVSLSVLDVFSIYFSMNSRQNQVLAPLEKCFEHQHFIFILPNRRLGDERSKRFIFCSSLQNLRAHPKRHGSLPKSFSWTVWKHSCRSTMTRRIILTFQRSASVGASTR